MWSPNENLDHEDIIETDLEIGVPYHNQPESLKTAEEQEFQVDEVPEETEGETASKGQSDKTDEGSIVDNESPSHISAEQTPQMAKIGYHCRFCNMYLNCLGFLKKHEKRCPEKSKFNEKQREALEEAQLINKPATSLIEPESQAPFDSKIRIPLGPVNLVNLLVNKISSQDDEECNNNFAFKKPRIECQFCKSPTNNSKSLKQHEIRCMLTFPVLYSCGICQIKFVCPALIKNHMSNSHNVHLPYEVWD